MKPKTPRTADGHPIRPGVKLWQLWTKDAGKTWRVGPLARIVDKTSGECVRLRGDRFSHMLCIGDNRLYLRKKNAVAEAERRMGRKS